MDIAEGRRGVRLRRGIIGAMVAVGALLATTLVAAAPARAGQVFFVDDDGQQCGSGASQTIGAALEAASDGDTITVCAGVYAERLHVTKSVRIIGPVDAVSRVDCFAEATAQPGDLDATQFAVLEPPPPATTEATDPVLTLDADGIELAGLVIQGVIDQTAALGNLWIPAAVSSDAHAGYRIHHNLFRSNTLGMEFGSSGAAESRFDHNCMRESSYGVGNQRLHLQNARIDSNESFGATTVAIEVGWHYRAASSVAVHDNVVRDATYGVFIENAKQVRVSGNHIDAPAMRGIWLSAGNSNVEVSDNLIEGDAARLTGSPAGIMVGGPTSGLVRSTGVVIRDNTVSGIRLLTSTGGVFGYGILLGFNALDGGGVIEDNITFGNGQGGITLFNNNTDNVVRDNVSYDNAWYGIRVQVMFSTGNLIQDNRMYGNLLADASDFTDTNPADGIQLLNTWKDNDCVTDQLAGAICGNG